MPWQQNWSLRNTEGSLDITGEQYQIMKREDLHGNATVRSVPPDGLVVVVCVEWFGSETLELTYRTPLAMSETSFCTVTIIII